MAQYINKSVLIMEIKRRLEEYKETLKNCDSTISGIVLKSSMSIYQNLLYFLDTLEEKEMDLEKEIDEQIRLLNGVHSMEDNHPFWKGTYNELMHFAKHFFELGISLNNPITAADRGTADEIITSLKQVESDYLIDHTKEIEWVRNKVQKG